MAATVAKSDAMLSLPAPRPAAAINSRTRFVGGWRAATASKTAFSVSVPSARHWRPLKRLSNDPSWRPYRRARTESAVHGVGDADVKAAGGHGSLFPLPEMPGDSVDGLWAIHNLRGTRLRPIDSSIRRKVLVVRE